jgi:hypothetical protein
MRAMRSKLVWLLLTHVQSHGGDAAALAARIGLPPEARVFPERLDDVPPVPIERVIALAEAAAQELRDPLLGINLAAGLPRGVDGVLEFALRHAPTLGEAAERLIRYERIHNDTLVWSVSREDRTASLGYTVPALADGLGRQLDELFAMTVLRFMRELAGTELAASEVRFAHRDRSSAAAAAEHFGTARIVFGAGATTLVFPAEAWHLASSTPTRRCSRSSTRTRRSSCPPRTRPRRRSRVESPSPSA